MVHLTQSANPSTLPKASGLGRGGSESLTRLLLNQRFGLGNQLFQYAAAVYFAEKYGAELEIIREDEQTAGSYGHARPFLLSKFAITVPVRDRRLSDRLLRSKSRAVSTLALPLRRALRVYSYDPDFRVVGEFKAELGVPRGVRRVYLNGHFQVRQYAESQEARLRREFTLREPATGANLEMLRRIEQSPCAVSVHVRLGDYVVEWDGRNLLPVTYYEAAIAEMLMAYPHATFFVFSDDIDAARMRLPGLRNAIFVDHNDESTAHEDLRLISSCRHHILANSTLSWWGAWLNRDASKKVLVPEPWHRTDPHPDLIPPEWQRVPIESRASVEQLVS